MKSLIRVVIIILGIWALFTIVTLGWQWRVRQQKARAENLVTEMIQARNELLQHYALLKDLDQVEQISEVNRDRQRTQIEEKLSQQLDKEISLSAESLERISRRKREESQQLVTDHNQLRQQRKEQMNTKTLNRDFSPEENLLERYFSLLNSLD